MLSLVKQSCTKLKLSWPPSGRSSEVLGQKESATGAVAVAVHTGAVPIAVAPFLGYL